MPRRRLSRPTHGRARHGWQTTFMPTDCPNAVDVTARATIAATVTVSVRMNAPLSRTAQSQHGSGPKARRSMPDAEAPHLPACPARLSPTQAAVKPPPRLRARSRGTCFVVAGRRRSPATGAPYAVGTRRPDHPGEPRSRPTGVYSAARSDQGGFMINDTGLGAGMSAIAPVSEGAGRSGKRSAAVSPVWTLADRTGQFERSGGTAATPSLLTRAAGRRASAEPGNDESRSIERLSCMRWRGLEPPRPIQATRPSTPRAPDKCCKCS
jgi:hypothetical protein